MSVPFKKRTKGSKLRRASHHALKQKNYIECERCKKPKLPHHACVHCGYYKGRSVFEQVVKTKKEPKKQDQKEKESAK